MKMKINYLMTSSLLIMIVISHFASAESITISDPNKFYLDIYDFENTADGAGDGEIYPGSGAFATCQAMINNNFKSQYESGGTAVNWNQSIVKNFCSAKVSKLNEALKSDLAKKDATTKDLSLKEAITKNSEDVKTLLTLSGSETNLKFGNLRTCMTPYLKKIPECIAMMNLTFDFKKKLSNPDHWKKQDATGGSQPSVINANQGSIGVSGSSNYGCTSAGIETLDFEACKKFSDYDQGLEVATKAVQVGQGLYYQNKALDTQMDANKNMANDATAALKAQKSNFKDQQEVFTQNSAIEASKVAYLGSIRYSEMPTRDKIRSACESLSGQFDNSLGNLNSSPGLSGQINTKESCKSIVDNSTRGFNIIANEEGLQKMTARCIQLGVNAVAEGTKAYFAGKRADQVGDAIANVNGFQPTTTPGLENAIETSFCQMNPTADKCLNRLPQQFSMIGDNIVDFSGGGAGTVYSPDADVAAGGGGGSAGSGTDSKSKGTNKVGSSIVGVTKGGGIIDSTSAATLAKGGPAAAGGGGGGGGGNVSAPGGLPQPAAQGGTSAAIATKGAKYDSGTGVSMLGGKGVIGSKKVADSANPFGNMFDKNKPGADKLVNFRGPASTNMGNKGDNLFDMISKRYTWANDKKLMMEYEEAK